MSALALLCQCVEEILQCLAIVVNMKIYIVGLVHQKITALKQCVTYRK